MVSLDSLTEEAREIVRVLKLHKNVHIHYWKEWEWDMYISYDAFRAVERGETQKGDVVLMSGNDFDSDYSSALVEALMYLQKGTVSSI